MFKNILFIFLLILPGISIRAQLTISGSVTDADSRLPVEYVTVYINGTTRGTISDSQGNFALQGDSYPCELIFSHVSYEILNYPIQNPGQLSNLRIELQKKIIPLEEASIVSLSARQKYISRFKLWFLGKDYKKTGADIMNDSVLRFIPLEGDQYEAYAPEPLEIELPQTGYWLTCNLIHFSHRFNEDLEKYHCSILGYFYFRELMANTRRKQRSFARNRTKTYYNSRLHFCRSLYKNNLNENGYSMGKRWYVKERDSLESPAKPDYSMTYLNRGSGDSLLLLHNFTRNLFAIEYHHKFSNAPIDLTRRKENHDNISWSRVYFPEDTIRIYHSGRVGDNSMLFDGEIGKKGVAWMLPEDYIPSMQ